MVPNRKGKRKGAGYVSLFTEDGVYWLSSLDLSKQQYEAGFEAAEPARKGKGKDTKFEKVRRCMCFRDIATEKYK
jgi:hypothetical protein